MWRGHQKGKGIRKSMTNYQLDFSSLTIGDMIPVLAHNPSSADVLILAHKVVVGGVYHLPPTEISTILQLVSTEFGNWIASKEFMKMVKAE